MASFEMKLSVGDVRLLVTAESPEFIVIPGGAPTPGALRVRSIRVAHADAELLGLINGETLQHIEHAMRQWAGVKERIARQPTQMEGVPNGC